MASRCTWKREDSLGKLLAKVAEHESEPRGVSGWRSSVDPTRTVVFEVSDFGQTGCGQTGVESIGVGDAGVGSTETGSGVTGLEQLPQELGAALAAVAKVAMAAAKRVKKCMIVFMRLGSRVG